MTIVEKSPVEILAEYVPGDEDKFAHIVKRGSDGKSADVIIMEAGIYGTPVQALCGFTWIPQRLAEKFPVCTYCLAEFKAMGGKL